MNIIHTVWGVNVSWAGASLTSSTKIVRFLLIVKWRIGSEHDTFT